MAHRRQPSPLDFITTLPNVMVARYSQAVLRAQARPRPMKSLLDEVFMPLENRTGAIDTAMKGASPAYISYANLLMFAQRGLSFIPVFLSGVVTQQHPVASRIVQVALNSALFHPFQARMIHLQAMPPPMPWTTPFTEGVWQTLKTQRFYARSLEPAVLRSVLHGFIHQFRLIDSAVARACPDPEFQADWNKIETDLIEEDTTEVGTLDEEAVHRRLQGLYAKRFHKWFMRTLTKTFLEDYVVRTLLFPVETVYVRLTCNAPTDDASPLFLPNAWRIVAEEGVAALYSGLSVALAAIVPHLACAWGFYFSARLAIALIDPAWLASVLAFGPPKSAAEAEGADSDEEDHKPAAH